MLGAVEVEGVLSMVYFDFALDQGRRDKEIFQRRIGKFLVSWKESEQSHAEFFMEDSAVA